MKETEPPSVCAVDPAAGDREVLCGKRPAGQRPEGPAPPTPEQRQDSADGRNGSAAGCNRLPGVAEVSGQRVGGVGVESVHVERKIPEAPLWEGMHCACSPCGRAELIQGSGREGSPSFVHGSPGPSVAINSEPQVELLGKAGAQNILWL